MIPVPAEIQELYAQDSVNKNFRVSFLDWEYPDLTNADIVSESVVFTESIGSTTGLKFGLCEGSTLEFQTFFNHNIRNMKIQAFIEVDISSLGEEFIETYGQTSDDVDFPFYRIPYGIFYVNSCKRNGVSNIRKIVAYQNKWDNDEISELITVSEFEKLKMTMDVSTNKPYTFDTLKFLCSSLNSTKLLDDLGGISITEQTITDSPIISRSVIVKSSWTGSTQLLIHSLCIEFTETSGGYPVPYPSAGGISTVPATVLTDVESIYRVTFENSLDTKSIIKQIQEEHPELFGEDVSEEYWSRHEFTTQYLDPTLCIGTTLTSSCVTIDSQSIVVYPFISQYYKETSFPKTPFVLLAIPIALEVNEKDETGHIIDTYQYTLRDTSSLHLKTYTFDSVDQTFDRKKYVDTGVTYYSAEYIAEDPKSYINTKDILSSYVELLGGFVRLARNSEDFEIVNLFGTQGIYPNTDIFPAQDLYPQSPSLLITRSLWKSVWYDDTPSNSYDTLVCNWKSPGGEMIHKEIVIVSPDTPGYFANNYQQYDVSNNYFIKTEGLLTEEQVDAFLNKLASVLKNVQYYVADIEMRGLPFVEAGDSVSIMTQDSGFSTFVLRHRISGIHALMDMIEAR